MRKSLSLTERRGHFLTEALSRMSRKYPAESESIQFHHIKITNDNYQGIKHRIQENIQHKGYICLVEVSGVMKSQKDSELFQALNSSMISIPDGAPLAWFGKLTGCQKMEHIPGYSLMTRMIEEKSDLKHFLLGDTNETIHAVINKAKSVNPGIQIEGFSPPFKEKFSVRDNEEMISRINDANADLIWVSFGLGKQEKWMHENYLKVNKGIMIGVGAAFKFYIGKICIPNRWVQRSGMTFFLRYRDKSREQMRNNFGMRLKFAGLFPIELMKASIRK